MISMILTSLPFTASADGENLTYIVNGINSYREADTLIIYNYSSGNTGSNPYGYEVRVDKNNRVISVGGNNSKIPEGGFVVSGHGIAADFLKENVKVGDKIVFLEERMIISIGENEPSPFYETTMDYNGINIYRSSGFAVIYTPSMGPTTQTNAYGYEVTVTDGIITSCGGYDSPIPENGYVISAHGTAATTLRGLAAVGIEVSYDTAAKKISFKFGERSLFLSDESRIKYAESCLEEAKKNCYVIDVNAMQQAVNDLRTRFDTMKADYEKSGKIDDYMSARKEQNELIDKICDGTSESRPVEYRAAWIEPSEKNREQVKETVKAAYDNGINTICLETFFASTMIYPTPEGSLFSQNPSLKGFDLLKAYIEECHALGMELHVWIPVFYVGNKGQKNSQLSIFDKKPEWRITDNKGGCYGDSTTQSLNPANKEACDYLIETYRYILETYDIDGFQLDYIRYPHNGDYDYGYDAATINAFKEKYGVEPEFSPSAETWKDWCQFRCDYVTDFVRRVRALIDEVAPNVMLSADLYGNIDVAPTAVYQDGRKWIEEGLLDIAYPMTYDETEGLISKATKYISVNNKKVMSVCGLGVYIASQNASTMRDQTKALRALRADGYSYFELSAYHTKEIGATLLKGAFSTKALAPCRDIYKSVTTYSDFMSRRVNEIMKPVSLLTDKEAEELTSLLKAVADGTLTEESIAAINDCISKLQNADAKAVLEYDMEFVQKLLNHYDWSGPREDSSTAEESEPTSEDNSSSESEASDSGSSSASDNTSSASSPETSDGGHAAPIIAAAAAVCAIAVAAVLIIKKKKKK